MIAEIIGPVFARPARPAAMPMHLLYITTVRGSEVLKFYS